MSQNFQVFAWDRRSRLSRLPSTPAPVVDYDGGRRSERAARATCLAACLSMHWKASRPPPLVEHVDVARVRTTAAPHVTLQLATRGRAKTTAMGLRLHGALADDGG